MPCAGPLGGGVCCAAVAGDRQSPEWVRIKAEAGESGGAAAGSWAWGPARPLNGFVSSCKSFNTWAPVSHVEHEVDQHFVILC